ncbi:MAG: hypothetical protein J07HQW2_02314 [Haloquadratum walsbyi J07HQW2]|jgi:transposase|uniref:Transposase n=1 Tax=Haloquadratum walsbyi J07HQW2 TaxID=1238425 RepID=U1MZD3_9EURY|nr:MAG: hypothetical protein J07HQW2_02314 [Haloquadratum walsbyi J07HQW2]
MALLDIPRPVVRFDPQYFAINYAYSSMLETTHTYRATVDNHSQVSDDLDDCGLSASASKLWNVARCYTQDQWDEDGKIPDDSELKSELNEHDRCSDLHSQPSQRVLEELAESVTGSVQSTPTRRDL